MRKRAMGWFKKVLVLLISLITLIPFVINGQSSVPLSISQIEGAIELDGIPDESAWQQIEPLPMTMHIPESGKEPTEKSDIRIGYTDEFLYIGARLYDSEPSKLQSSALERDSGSPTDDFFGIVLDTFNDNENALAFFVTPDGVRSDFSVYNDSQGEAPFNVSWSTFWDAETVVTDEGWFTEMRIPLSSLRYESLDGIVRMGLIAHRWIARKSESSLFPAIPNEWGWFGQWKPSQSQNVLFTNLENKRPFYVTPYLLGGFGQHHQLNNSGTEWVRNDQFTYDVGLDVKYGLTSNMTLDLTLNTDFAQVEADNQQVNLTRFSLFFPEKRKFFQERSSLFDFNLGGPNRLFYSRRIGVNNGQEVRILGGARLVGRVGGWDLGFINMQTARNGSVGIPAENFGVLRLRRRVINRHSYVGSMFTSRIGDDGAYNYAYGVDGIFRVFDDKYLTAIYAQSLDGENNNDAVSLDASRLLLDLETRSTDGFGYNFSFSRSGPEYNPGIGFEARDNYSRFASSLSYGWFAGENSPFINHQLSLDGELFLGNTNGITESSNFGPRWNSSWKNGSSLNAGTNLYYENLTEPFQIFEDVVVPAGKYYFYGFEGRFSTPDADLFTTAVNLQIGQFFDGYRISNGFNLSWSLSKHLKLEPFYEFNWINFPSRENEFTAHVARVRLKYYFSTKLMVSTFAQYSNASSLFISNFRLRYNPKEGNDLYIVYNEGLNTERRSYLPVRPLSTGRTILVKYTYTFNY